MGSSTPPCCIRSLSRRQIAMSVSKRCSFFTSLPHEDNARTNGVREVLNNRRISCESLVRDQWYRRFVGYADAVSSPLLYSSSSFPVMLSRMRCRSSNARRRGYPQSPKHHVAGNDRAETWTRLLLHPYACVNPRVVGRPQSRRSSRRGDVTDQ